MKPTKQRPITAQPGRKRHEPRVPRRPQLDPRDHGQRGHDQRDQPQLR